MSSEGDCCVLCFIQWISALFKRFSVLMHSSASLHVQLIFIFQTGNNS